MLARLTLACLALLPAACCIRAQQAASAAAERLDRQFQAAVAQYESARFLEAATALEALLSEVPESFEVHELLGLVYSAQSQDAKASPHLEEAVRLRPGSASARMNLAINLVQLGKLQPAEMLFKKALDLEPQNYDANHNLGELYVRAGRVPAAMRQVRWIVNF